MKLNIESILILGYEDIVLFIIGCCIVLCVMQR